MELIEFEKVAMTRALEKVETSAQMGVHVVTDFEKSVRTLPQANAAREEEREQNFQTMKLALRRCVDNINDSQEAAKKIFDDLIEDYRTGLVANGVKLGDRQLHVLPGTKTIDAFEFGLKPDGRKVGFVILHQANSFLFGKNTTIQKQLPACPYYKTFATSQEIIRKAIGEPLAKGILLITLGTWDKILDGRVDEWLPHGALQKKESEGAIARARINAHAAIRDHIRHLSTERYRALKNNTVEPLLAEPNENGELILELACG